MRNDGFGLIAKPAGAWVIKNGKVTWQPALDLDRWILAGHLVGSRRAVQPPSAAAASLVQPRDGAAASVSHQGSDSYQASKGQRE